jgi:hypothetical protein
MRGSFTGMSVMVCNCEILRFITITSKTGVSDNAGCQVLFEHTNPCTPKSAISLY